MSRESIEDLFELPDAQRADIRREKTRPNCTWRDLAIGLSYIRASRRSPYAMLVTRELPHSGDSCVGKADYIPFATLNQFSNALRKHSSQKLAVPAHEEWIALDKLKSALSGFKRLGDLFRTCATPPLSKWRAGAGRERPAHAPSVVCWFDLVPIT